MAELSNFSGYFLVYIIFMAVLLYQASSNYKNYKFNGWFWVYISLFLAALFGAYWLEAYNSILMLDIAFVLTFLFVAIPFFAVEQVKAASEKNKVKKMSFFATLAYLFHPMDNYKLLHKIPDFIKRIDNQEGLEYVFNSLKFNTINQRSQLNLFIGGILYDTYRFKDFITWYENYAPTEVISLKFAYNYALGESGQPKKLIQWAYLNQNKLDYIGYYLPLLIYTGQPHLLERLLSVINSAQLEEEGKVNVLTAKYIAGETLSEEEEKIMRSFLNRDKNFTLVKISNRLSEQDNNKLNDLLILFARQLKAIEAKTQKIPETKTEQYPITIALIASIGTAYVLRFVFPGDLLYQVGVFVTMPEFYIFQPWRFITYAFLHADFMHFAFNSIALLIFGKLVEPLLGRFRFLLCYFGAVVGSVLFFLLTFNIFGDAEFRLLVGASGGIMGLVGAKLGISAIEYFRSKSLMDKEDVISILVIVGIQSIIDIATPRISLTAHLGGVISGLVIGSLLYLTVKKPSVDIEA